jgi:hypothetical protein
MAGSVAGHGPKSSRAAKETAEETENDICGARVVPVVNALTMVSRRNSRSEGITSETWHADHTSNTAPRLVTATV